MWGKMYHFIQYTRNDLICLFSLSFTHFLSSATYCPNNTAYGSPITSVCVCFPSSVQPLSHTNASFCICFCCSCQDDGASGLVDRNKGSRASHSVGRLPGQQNHTGAPLKQSPVPVTPPSSRSLSPSFFRRASRSWSVFGAEPLGTARSSLSHIETAATGFSPTR